MTAEEEAFAESQAERAARVREAAEQIEEEARKRARRVTLAQEEARRAEGLGKGGSGYNDMP